MISWRRRGVRFGEVWFDEPAPDRGVDVLWLRQRPAPERGSLLEEKHSLEIDLTQPQDDIFGRFKKDTRGEIRRAERDGVVYEAFDAASDPQAFRAFLDGYDLFARQRDLPPLDREYVAACRDAGVLDLSRALDQEGQTLVWHSHLQVAGRARLLHSASQLAGDADAQRRALAGRANRLAHWRDMQRFAERGLSRYDFGGWYSGETDQRLLQINRFKEEFGGVHVVQYNIRRALTPVGGFYCLISSLRKQRVRRTTP